MIPKGELRWYLFEDPVASLEKSGYQNFQDTFNHHMELYLSYYHLIEFGGFLSEKIPISFGNSDKDKIMVHHLLYKYQDILRYISHDFKLEFLAKTPLSFSHALKNRASLVSIHKIYRNLYHGILNNNETQLEESLNNLIAVFKRSNPKLLLVNHDIHPEDRLMILAAKNLRIPTIEIQHGVYTSTEPITTGKESDFVFVWGKFFRNLYLDQKIKKSDQIRILGYPYPLNNINIVKNQQIKSLVYLGQNLELLCDDFFEKTIKTVKSLKSICKRLGLNFLFRPHPSDDTRKLKRNLPNVKFISKSESLINTFQKSDIFISFNSTALIEAVLNSKIGIQLKNFDLNSDDFEELGICRTIEDIDDMEEELKSIIRKDLEFLQKPVNQDYIMIPPEGPGKRFLDLLNNINMD